MNPARIAGWWVRDYAYAAIWQVRAFFNRTEPASFLGGDLVPIVVIPGVYETWKFMQPLIAAVHGRGHPVHVLPVLRHNRRPVPDAAARVRAYLDEQGLECCVILAHSKGGLVGKLVMTQEPAERVTGMLAVSAPFAGSVYGNLMVLPSLRIFSPRSSTIVSLAKQTAVNARIVSIYGTFDPHIPGGSELPGAKKNVVLDTGGHFRVLADPRVMAELAVLSETPGA